MNDLLARVTAFLLAERCEAYLVGGTVRDQELGRQTHDIDLAAPRNALQIARKLADSFGGVYYPLDPERETGRVILPDRSVIDVSRLRGLDIDADLSARDFTVNAMARRLDRPDSLIDPQQGLRDLRQRQLRAVGDDAFVQDPARLLRAVRQAAELEFVIEPETRKLIERDAPLVVRLAGERARDELLGMLQRSDAATSLRALAGFGLLVPLLPGAVLDEVHLATIGRLGRFAVKAANDPDPAAALIAEFGALLRSDLLCDPDTGQTNGAIVKLAALYDGAAHIASDLGNLRFRRDEIQYARHLVAQRKHMQGILRPVSPLSAHRFFRDSGTSAGRMGLIVLALAAESVPGGETGPMVELIRQLLTYYRDNYELIVAPKPLMNGAQLAERFGLQGRQIGQGLMALQEAQVTGKVQTVAEAEVFFASPVPSMRN